MSKIKTIRETEVLVVGGGGAGITAAVAAARGGAKVLLVSKGQAGNSGNTIMIGGSYAMDGYSAYHDYGLKGADPSLTKDVLYKSIVDDGFALNDQNMVEQFVEDSPAIVYEVMTWAEKAGKPFDFGPPATWSMSGTMMGNALKYGLKSEPNIEALDDVIVVELLKNNGKICGAIAIDIMSGDVIQINAKAVVLGTGGYQPFSFKNTNSDMTGDGPAMAFRAGAKLADMEFVLFLLSALEPHHMKGSILPLMVSTNANFKYRAVNGKGEELVVPPKLKELESKSEICKLVDLVYYGDTICNGPTGPNGGFYMETLNTPEELDQVCHETEMMFEGFYKKGHYHGEEIKEVFDLMKETGRWECGLSNEYSLGGIYVDEKMQTTVPGLFAGGECASGVFGACRVADAVTEMVVQGYRAGETAAEYVKNADVSFADGGAVADDLLSVFDRKGSMTVTDALRRLEEISDKGLNCIRTEEGTAAAVKEFEQLESELDTIGLTNPSRVYNYEWIQYVQLRNRVECSKLCAIMAQLRRESRGLHLRSDYPELDNESFLVRTFAELKDGKVDITTRRPIEGKVPMPAPEKIDYKEYLLTADLGLENLVYKEEKKK